MTGQVESSTPSNLQVFGAFTVGLGAMAATRYVASYITWMPETAASFVPFVGPMGAPMVKTMFDLGIYGATFCALTYTAHKKGWWPVSATQAEFTIDTVTDALNVIINTLNSRIPEEYKEQATTTLAFVRQQALEQYDKKMLQFREFKQKQTQKGITTRITEWWYTPKDNSKHKKLS